MGSKVWTTSVATDNRLAVTDNAFGLSSSGSGNNTALEGHIFNLGAGGSGVAKGSGGGAGSNTVNILDGGAIDKSFDFAAFSLSAMLDSVINGQKVQQQTAQYTADTIGQAVTQAAAVQQASTEATAQSMTTQKKIIIGAVVAAVAWYVWKGSR